MMLSSKREDLGLSPSDDMPTRLQQDADAVSGISGKGLDCSLQLGDMGIFTKRCSEELPDMDQHKFFRGNHDNPALCRMHHNYLGDWGYHSKNDMFWVSGGYSIDRHTRTIGIDWWEDEELSTGVLMDVLQYYADVKPKIMITHECPSVIKESALSNPGKRNITSRTELALQAMYEVHQPELWVYGHHHQKVDKVMGKTRFIGLNEMKWGPLKECMFEIPGLTWDGV